LFQEDGPYFFLADLSVPTAGFGFVGIVGFFVTVVFGLGVGFFTAISTYRLSLTCHTFYTLLLMLFSLLSP
jgi:hypothetical protein